MKSIILFIFVLCFSLVINAQKSQVDSLLDLYMFEEAYLKKETKQNYHFLYLRTNYNNKTMYAGREIGDNLFNASGQLVYFNSWGLHFGVAGSWYSATNPNYMATILSAGYSKNLKKIKGLSVRTSYNHFIYNNPDFDPTYNGAVNFGASFSKKWFGTRIDYTLLAGSEFGSQVSCDIYSKINLYKSKKHFKVQFKPEISFFFSPETVEYEQYNYLDEDYYLYDTEYITEETFGLLNTQIIVPVSINYKNFDFEVSYLYNIPNSPTNIYEYDNSSQFRISLGYFFGLNRKK